MRNFIARTVRLLAAAFVIYILGVVALGALYRFVPPVSTLMVGRWITFQPVKRDWVHMSAISRSMKHAVVTAEDGKFCEHHGVDWDAMQDAVEDALDDGDSKGASTISMQVAKNLFLWPQRSYIRKALELPIAMYLDFIWPKKRMLEVYLNIAELGDGVYGAEAASRLYFHKSAAALSRGEAVMLAASLPSPVRHNPNHKTRGYERYIGIINGRLARGGASISCVR